MEIGINLLEKINLREYDNYFKNYTRGDIWNTRQ